LFQSSKSFNMTSCLPLARKFAFDAYQEIDICLVK